MGLGTAATLSLISTGVQTGMSFKQVADQNAKMQAANDAADEALAEARKKLDVNFLEETSIATEAYKLERESQNLAGARATDAAVQSERGSAATAGRVMAAENDAARDTSARMETALVDRENKILTEEGRLRDELVTIEKDIAEGAASAMADANAASTAAMTNAIAGITSGVTGAFEASDLYKQDLAAQRVGATGIDFSADEITNFNQLGGKRGTQFDPNLNFNAMTEKDFKKWKRGLNDEQWAMITGNQGYISNLNN